MAPLSPLSGEIAQTHPLSLFRIILKVYQDIPAEDLISGKVTFKQILHPEDIERVRKNKEAYQVSTKCDEYDQEYFRIIARGGEIKWVSEQTFIKRDKSGKILHYRTVILDITDQKEYETLMQNNNEQAYTTINAISDAIFLYPICEEEYKKFIEVNDAACKLYGYSREELLKLTVMNITDMSDNGNQDILNFEKASKENKNFIFETVHRTKSGETFPVEINTSRVNHLGQEVILSVVRDISDRKNIEESLRIIQYSLDKAAIGAFCLKPGRRNL